ncbi:CG10165 [Drosophila busckii]|uniref:ascorbate ferrireductase (transmembrane) n=1 Tax=Drosophila busckii TaxID=30019 RepID=A0A0M4ENJ8_DROBS|nr:uncharacterized protein LOC108604365 [Drosophila busckii]ALC38020.1 CG10165 [Drosophila busckii]
MPQAKNSAWLQIQSILNSINHMLILLVAVFFFVLARSLDFKDTAMHMFLTGTGFHVLISEALMSHYKINPITRWISHKNKSRYHGLLQVIGGSMVLLGAVGKFTDKDVHWNTWHGRIGSAAALGCFASLVGGLANFFQPKIALKYYSPSELRFRHNLFGLINFTQGMAAIFLGYYSRFFTRFVDNQYIPALMLTTALVYLLTMIGPVSSLLTKLKYRRQRAQ